MRSGKNGHAICITKKRLTDGVHSGLTLVFLLLHHYHDDAPVCRLVPLGRARVHHGGRWGAILGPIWEHHHGCCCVGVSWNRLGLSSLVRVAAGFGGVVLERVFRRLAVDYSTWASGAFLPCANAITRSCVVS